MPNENFYAPRVTVASFWLFERNVIETLLYNCILLSDYGCQYTKIVELEL